MTNPATLPGSAAWLEQRRLAGWTFFNARDFTRALTVCYESMAVSPRTPWIYYLMAQCYFRQGMRNAAAGLLRVFLSLERDPGTPWHQRASALLLDIRRHALEVDAQHARLQPLTSFEATPLSVNMIVRDEAPRLKRLLPGVLALKARQLVAVDTGSVDETPEILRAAGFEVIHADWRDDFAWARNVALDASHEEWCMWIDGDDWLDVDAPALIASLLASRPSADFHGLRLSYGGTFSSQVRLWRRTSGARWTNALHERIAPPDAIPDEHPEIIVFHSDDERRPDKIERNRRMLGDLIARDPMNSYWRFYAAMTEAAAGNIGESLKHADVYMGMTSDIPKHMPGRNFVRYIQGVACVRAQPPQLQMAIHYARQAMAGAPCAAETWCLLGDAYLLLQRPLDAYFFYESAVHVGYWNWARWWLTDSSKYDDYPRRMMGKIRDSIGRDTFDAMMSHQRYPASPYEPVRPL